MYKFWLKFYCSSFPRANQQYPIIGSDNGFALTRRQAIISTNDDYTTDAYMHNSCLNELIFRVYIGMHWNFNFSFKIPQQKHFLSSGRDKYCIGHCVSINFIPWIWSLGSLETLTLTTFWIDHILAVDHWFLNTLRPRQNGCHSKMDAIPQTTFSNAISWMKMFEFRLKFHWSLFLKVQLTIFQHWFR